jgi:thioredoxin reductase (NADPH)
MRDEAPVSLEANGTADVRGARLAASAGDGAETVTESAAERAGAYPVLDETQLEVLSRYGHEREVSAGQTLVSPGDTGYDFLVVLRGAIEVLHGAGTAAERLIVRFGPGGFVGSLNNLTGQTVQVTSRASGPGRVLALKTAELRRVISHEPALSELILRAFLLRRARLMRLGAGVKVIGSRYSPATRQLLDILMRNRVPMTWLDLETDRQAEQLLRAFSIAPQDTPVVVTGRSELLRNPSLQQLRTALGLGARNSPGTYEPDTHDLVVVGAGPAGLAATVYGASEGLATVLVDSTAIGGQAGTSSRIENYLGFPAGVSGEELAARAALQAEKFAAQILVPHRAVRLGREDGMHVVELDDGTALRARTVVIATGARYRRLPLARLEEFEGAGVYYAATQAEAQLCFSHVVGVVGGGNSAGQAAIFLADRGSQVHLIIRRDSLVETMSRYLIDQIVSHPRIIVEPRCEVRELVGDGSLRAIILHGPAAPEGRQIDMDGLFVFIGADPCTEWLEGQLADDRGFILTAADIPVARRSEHGDTVLPLETSRPGVFCVGDARAGSVKRVAVAVGEGSMAVRLVHDRLGAGDPARKRP